jgi:hypothetical protein
MIKIYLLMFVIVAVISYIWVRLIDNMKNKDDKD